MAEPLPERVVDLALQPRHLLPLVEQGAQPVTGALPLGGGGQRLGLRDDLLLGVRAPAAVRPRGPGRPLAPLSTSASTASSRASSPARSPTACASVIDSRRWATVVAASLGGTPPARIRCSRSATWPASSSNLRPKYASASSWVVSGYDPTGRSPSAVRTKTVPSSATRPHCVGSEAGTAATAGAAAAAAGACGTSAGVGACGRSPGVTTAAGAGSVAGRARRPEVGRRPPADGGLGDCRFGAAGRGRLGDGGSAAGVGSGRRAGGRGSGSAGAASRAASRSGSAAGTGSALGGAGSGTGVGSAGGRRLGLRRRRGASAPARAPGRGSASGRLGRGDRVGVRGGGLGDGGRRGVAVGGGSSLGGLGGLGVSVSAGAASLDRLGGRCGSGDSRSRAVAGGPGSRRLLRGVLGHVSPSRPWRS